MSAHFWLRSAAGWRWPTPLGNWRTFSLAVLAVLIQGCAAQPPQQHPGSSAFDPEARVPPVRYRSTLGTYSSQRPVEPMPWRERNDGVAPVPKEDAK